MRRTLFRSVAAVSCTLAVFAGVFPAPARGARRPRYGGTLRVKWQARLEVFDPHHAFAESREQSAADKLRALLFDRLVARDVKGRLEPQLAISWTQDGAARHWEFRLRPGVRFSDGTPLTPEIAARALEKNSAACKVSASTENVVFDCASGNYEMPQEMAELRNSIVGAVADGTAKGTGPFRMAEWQAGRRATLKANEYDWRGRAYLDAVDVEMGVTPREQLIALELGKADVIEMNSADVRRAEQGKIRSWASLPNELMAIVFEAGRPAAAESRVREALARAIDRAAIHNVLLQKQGEPAGGLLPQWLSGYEFLFSLEQDIARAREMVAAFPPSSRRLTLQYDPGDPVAGAIAERIAVNARDCGLALEPTRQPRAESVSGPARAADARLVRLPIEGAEPSRALAQLVSNTLGSEWKEWKQRAGPLDSESLYKEERNFLQRHLVIPLFHMPHIYGLSARVKNWNPSTTGEWRMEEIWLEAERP